MPTSLERLRSCLQENVEGWKIRIKRYETDVGEQFLVWTGKGQGPVVEAWNCRREGCWSVSWLTDASLADFIRAVRNTIGCLTEAFPLCQKPEYSLTVVTSVPSYDDYDDYDDFERYRDFLSLFFFEGTPEEASKKIWGAIGTTDTKDGKGRLIDLSTPWGDFEWNKCGEIIFRGGYLWGSLSPNKVFPIIWNSLMEPTLGETLATRSVLGKKLLKLFNKF